MRDLLSNSIFFGVAVSIFGYEAGLFLKRRFNKAIFNPLLISIVFVMLVLTMFRVDYDSYNNGAKYLSYLLTPATVCLAIPLYLQFNLLRKNMKAIIIGILSGVFASLSSVFVMSLLFKFTHEQYVTLLPKSITTAIGIGLSEEMGGMVTITVAVIIITGILGSIIAETICRFFLIEEPIAKGLAIGTSSHAIGTVKAIELGEIEGAMSSLAIAVSGLMTVVAASVFANFI
ncbi:MULTISPECIES: LrgB family protein [Paenibacillus]|uniref:LrgB family protein n=1 Tax=Paenibacillus TaxID=44249 RepID=UPI003009DF5E